MAIAVSGEPVIGIDLGTTTVCAALFDGKKTHILASNLGQPLTPSYYAVTEQRRVFVGQAAKNQAITNPEGTVTAFKRLMGLRFETPKAKSIMAQVPYPIADSGTGFAYARLHGRNVSPVEMSASVLSEVKDAASELLGRPVTLALVTVPADYNEEQRQATTLAVTMAGFKLVRLLNEPTAAALAFCAGRPVGNSTIAIYDLGGGTFDVTIMSIHGTVF
jgi:molecular chaperone DnaK